MMNSFNEGCRREMLKLGVLGAVPVDSLFELFLETKRGDILTIYQTRFAASIGGWVYQSAICLAKYLESDHFRQQFTKESSPNQTLMNQRVVEIGAGTGMVGIMAAYCGASVIITDLESLVPLIDYNIQQNALIVTGKVIGKSLCWGNHVDDDVKAPNFLILANCVYYENSLEVLLETVLTITNDAKSTTVILACYEERTKEIRTLIEKWHAMLQPYFIINDVPQTELDPNYTVDYVKLVTMLKRDTASG